MKRTQINRGYRRERKVLKKMGVQPTLFSGSKSHLGTQDGETETCVVQVKSTASNRIAVTYAMLFDVRCACKPTQIPLLVLDFCSPQHGDVILPDEQWVCLRLCDYERLQGENDEKGSNDTSDMGRGK